MATEASDMPIDPYDQVTRCEPCNAKFSFKGRRPIKFCPYCGKETTILAEVERE